MKWFFKRLWCSLRGHPYKVIIPPRDYSEPMITWEEPYCSNCGATFSAPRGMRS
jgi:hypothetical protein